jgi:hypothetical protein
MPQKYTDAGALVVSTTEGLIKEGDTRYVVKCAGCRSLIEGGAESRVAHDKFHEALAGLFETVQKMKESN